MKLIERPRARPQSFSASDFATPAGGITVTLTRGRGWTAGAAVRLEVFVQANLLRAAEFTIPEQP